MSKISNNEHRPIGSEVHLGEHKTESYLVNWNLELEHNMKEPLQFSKHQFISLCLHLYTELSPGLKFPLLDIPLSVFGIDIQFLDHESIWKLAVESILGR